MDQHFIKPLAETELDLLRRISIETFRDTFAEHNTTENMEQYIATNLSPEKLKKEVSNPGSEFYLSIYGGDPSGYLKLNVGDAQTEFGNADEIEIERIYVLKKYQGQRVGARLLKHVLEVALTKNLKYIWLGVWEHNENAIAFYTKFGFSPTGYHEFFLGSDMQTDIIMRVEVSVLAGKFQHP